MRLYLGGYGHNPSTSGKMYAYYGGDNYRVGENVVAPVEHWKSGKLYNTMFTIQSTYDTESIPGQYELGKLQGINLKSIGGRDVMELPGASQYTSKAQWTRESAKTRLLSRNVQTDTTQASQRLINRGM